MGWESADWLEVRRWRTDDLATLGGRAADEDLGVELWHVVMERI